MLKLTSEMTAQLDMRTLATHISDDQIIELIARHNLHSTATEFANRAADTDLPEEEQKMWKDCVASPDGLAESTNNFLTECGYNNDEVEAKIRALAKEYVK